MNVDCVSLPLTSSLQEEQTILVRATNALRLCREGGHRMVSWQQAVLHINDLCRRDMVSIREFLSRARITSFPLAMLDHRDALTQLRRSIKRGDLVALRKCEYQHGGRINNTSDNRQSAAYP